jgi:hypothetical protein
MSRSRALAALTAALLTGLLTAGSSPAAANADDVCTASLVHRFANNGPQGAREYFVDESTEGLGAAWAYCQFRLYDDNDEEASPDAPEVPHVFSEDDWFLGGILIWLERRDLEVLGFNHQEGIEFLKEIEERFYFGRQGSRLVEMPLRQSRYQDVVIDPSLGPLLINQRYHIFPAESLSPGMYEWRYVQTWPEEFNILFPDAPLTFVTHGAVRIIDD